MPKKPTKTKTTRKPRKKKIVEEIKIENDMEKSNSSGIFLLIIIIAVTVLSAIYISQRLNVKKTQRNLEGQISNLQEQLEEAGSDKEEINVKIEKLQNKIDEIDEKEAQSKWYNYENKDLDITFEYPGTWSEFELNTKEEGSISLSAKVNELEEINPINTLSIFGINDEYPKEEIHSHSCATIYETGKQFCKDGCEILDNGIVIDYRNFWKGDATYTALAYTTQSKKYPSICIELDMTYLLNKLSEEKNIMYIDAYDEYKFEDLVKEEKIDEASKKALDNFRRFAESIKPIETK